MVYVCACGKSLESGDSYRDKVVVKHYDTKYHKKHAPVKYEVLYKKHFENQEQKEISKILLDNTPLYQDIINVILEYAKNDTIDYYEECLLEVNRMINYVRDERIHKKQRHTQEHSILLLKLGVKRSNINQSRIDRFCEIYKRHKMLKR